MTNSLLEEIPTLVKNNQISLDEGAKKLWKYIFQNKRNFGLLGWKEDDCSEFLLELFPKLKVFINSFEPGNIKFSTFLYSCINNYKQSWQRKWAIHTTYEKTLEIALRNAASEYVQSTPLPSYQSKKKPKSTKAKKTSTKHKTNAKLTTLILALKSCQELNDETIDKVCDFTQVEKSELLEMIESLKKTKEKTATKRNHLINRRNRAYLFHRAYNIKLSLMDSNNDKYNEIRRKYENQTKKWKEQNKMLLHRYSIAPRNKDIAEKLGIKPRKVYFCISHVKKDGVIEEMQKIYREECTSS